jgi:hypothetical protein
MHEIAPLMAVLRRGASFFVPRSWLTAQVASGAGPRPRRPSRARMELDPGAPAASWVVWEISRSGRPTAQG